MSAGGEDDLSPELARHAGFSGFGGEVDGRGPPGTGLQHDLPQTDGARGWVGSGAGCAGAADGARRMR